MNKRLAPAWRSSRPQGNPPALLTSRLIVRAASGFQRHRFGVALLVILASMLAWLPAIYIPHSATKAIASTMMQTSSDPVIAAVGDIACDPTNSNFNGGNGSSSSCRQKYTSDLLINANLAAVLPLGDNQYYCGGYQAFVHPYDLSWGRVKSITQPVSREPRIPHTRAALIAIAPMPERPAISTTLCGSRASLARYYTTILARGTSSR
jgi:hypothetical protein